MLEPLSENWKSAQNLVYLVAAIMFIFALKAMASPKTARRGNLLGAFGMLLAIVFTLVGRKDFHWTYIIVGVVIGSAVGAYLALTVKMTAMPQIVAIFNGLGGLASAMVVMVYIWRFESWRPLGGELVVTTAVSSLIGWITLTGSFVAFAKLQEFFISGRPVSFPFQKVANFAVLGIVIVLTIVWGIYPRQRWLVIPIALLSAGFGVMFVTPIGGADMPVVICLLNSYSGLAAAATGFVLNNKGLIIAGSLVGASGVILTHMMCVAMNRSLANVFFGGVGKIVSGPGGGDGERKNVTSWTPEDAAMTLENSSLVIVVPGYGMAVAQAQHAIKELCEVLEERGVTVKFGIHPVAGRMPGHMNVLLAEADVPYDQLLDMDEINPEFERADAVLVIGANDVVNPAARHDESSPIYGMPILNVDKAGAVMICKRTLNPGFAGIDNDLFYRDNTAMIFGDGKKTVTAIVAALKE